MDRGDRRGLTVALVAAGLTAGLLAGDRVAAALASAAVEEAVAEAVAQGPPPAVLRRFRDRSDAERFWAEGMEGARAKAAARMTGGSLRSRLRGHPWFYLIAAGLGGGAGFLIARVVLASRTPGAG